jgi:hypothetical protein
LKSNTTGIQNVGIGNAALASNTTGSGNVAIGFQSGSSVTTASANTSVGLSALQVNTASNNTAVGYQAGYSNTTATRVTAIGMQAGYRGTTGSNYSTYVGYKAGYLATGQGNVCIGDSTGESLTTGAANTFIGANNAVTGSAGQLITTGSKNTIIGAYNGNQGGLDIRTASNYIVLSDGDGNPRAWIGAGNNNDLFRVGTTSTATSSWMHQISYSQTSRAVIGITNDTAGANPNGIAIEYTASGGNTSTDSFVVGNDTGGNRFQLRNNGGLANYAANNVILSDRREKTNFTPATSYLDKICAIPVQTFNYIDQNLEEDDGLTLGVVAQDVQAVAPEFVTESNWGTKESPKMRLEIYQTDLQYALMKCIQEQQAMIEDLKTRLAAAGI